MKKQVGGEKKKKRGRKQSGVTTGLGAQAIRAGDGGQARVANRVKGIARLV
jgi:hypothetical protein